MSRSIPQDHSKSRPFRLEPVRALGVVLCFVAASGMGAEDNPSLDGLVGQPAELSAWAYVYRADRAVQEKPEAHLIPRRLERLDHVYRPVSLWFSQENEKQRAGRPPHPGLLSHQDVGELGAMLPRPEGALRSALLWEGRMQLDRLELRWPKDGAPAQKDVETRVYPAPFGWFGWQRDQQVTINPEVSTDGLTWVYRGDWNGVDMVAVFVRSGNAVPMIRAYGPERWERMEVEIEWGFKPGTENAEFDGRVEGFFGKVGQAAPLPDDAGTTMTSPIAWKSHVGGTNRRGIVASLWCLRPTIERYNGLPIYPYGHPRDTRITVWTKSGNFTFMPRDLEKGPILAPEYGFFVRATGQPSAQLTKADTQSLLDRKIDALLGNPQLHGWGVGRTQGVALGAMVNLLWNRANHNPDTPWFAGNATDEPIIAQGITLPGHSVAAHPGHDSDVSVGWRSPLDGRVRVTGNVAHAQPVVSDGVEWSVVSESAAGQSVLIQGVIDRGGRQTIPSTDVAVRQGDLLSLVIGRRDNHTCDSTVLNLVISEIGGQDREWDLAKDVVAHLPEGNPLADSFGNAGVWSFFQPASLPGNPPPVRALASQSGSAREFMRELASANVKSIRAMTRERREATWDEAMREIKLPLLRPGATLPPYGLTEDPPMQVEVPESRWQDAWRMGTSQLRKGELSYMDLALEAPRPIHDMDLVGLHDAAAARLDDFLRRPGTLADGDFCDGSGNFCIGKLFHETAIIDVPGHPTYELVHNGGTGRILYDLAEHYMLTGDGDWFRRNQWRMQAAAEWIIRQRTDYLKGVPNREDLWAAGLHPPQHIADCAWGYSEWKWYTNIDAWNYQGLHRFGEAMRDIDPDNAARYLAESDLYREAIRKAVDRAITLAPVMLARDGTYRSYIPPLLYVRGPSIEQVIQIGMTDQDWSLQALDAAGVPSADDIRVDGHLDVCEDVLAMNATHLHGGNRYWFLTSKRKERGLSSTEDWFWGGFAPQLGYTSLANVYLRRDEVSSFLRQWVNNYAAFVVPIPDYCFNEHFMNQADPRFCELLAMADHRPMLGDPGYRNGHALSYFMEQFRNLLVWEEGDSLWLAKATPRHWLEQGKKIAVSRAPTYFGEVAYTIVSDADHDRITATVEMPSRTRPKQVILRFRHPRATPIKSVTVNGEPWKDIDQAREAIFLHDVQGSVQVECDY